jgi:SPP1 family predicted phage head-tail adaptor
MTPGKLNRRITIQRRTASKDAVGGKTDTWATFREVWAELVQQKGNVGIVVNAEKATHQTQWRIRFISELNEQDFRIFYQGRYYDLGGIEPEGLKVSQLISTTQTQAVPV